jgi:hypothetical protein
VLPPAVTQLAWARLALVAADGDTISRSFSQAAQGGRKATVGNVAYTLYRDTPATGPALLSTAESSANFRLAGAAAQLVWSDRGRDMIEVAQVDKGTLSVDFAHATYATQLSVSNPRLGSESVVSNGLVKTDGLLQWQGGNAVTSGALSLNGKEAGYFFQKTLSAGQLSGITLWGR